MALQYCSKYDISEKSMLFVLLSAHGLVDACCAVTVLSMINIYPVSNTLYTQMIIVYNVLAFGLQPFCGIFLDFFPRLKYCALSGIVCTIAAIVSTFHSAWISVILAGIGNAFYHVAGGIAALKLRPGRAAPSGYYVAPGALGLAVGGYFGSKGIDTMWPFIGLLFIALICITLIKFPEGKNESITHTIKKINYGTFVIILLLLAIALRSLTGFVSGSPWKDNKAMLLIIAVAAASGKALGGFIADRFGWLMVGATTLILSSFFLSIWPNQTWGIVCGTILLQMTMPITLAALYQVLPGKPGFAFGLSCLSLVIGALPVLTYFKLGIPDNSITFCGILISIFFFIISLYLLTKGRGTIVLSQKSCTETVC